MFAVHAYLICENHEVIPSKYACYAVDCLLVIVNYFSGIKTISLITVHAS